MQSGVLWDLKSQIRQGFVKSVGSRILEGSSTLGRLCLEGLLLFVYFNFIFQWIDLLLGRRRRGFLPSSLISSSMSWCYLVVASLFPYSCALLLLFVIHIYALEQLSVLSRPKPQRVQSMRKTSQSTCRFFFSPFLTIQSTKIISSTNIKNYYNNPIEYTLNVSQSSKH